ncbi:MAG TPA: glycosyltransferase family 87 protein [Candidatus Limnocylindrales bacterium]|nr:glycosyltransferase family 87 protein [Candidatus Limnocylindrales bacterium]
MTDRPWLRAPRAFPRLSRALQELRSSRLFDPTSTPLRRLVWRRLGMDAVLVVGAVLVVLRLGNAFPWTLPTTDMHAYWTSRDALNYDQFGPFMIGAYLYSPAFAHAIAPLTALNWPTFAGVWTAILFVALGWLAGRWSLLLLLFSVAVPLELMLGQVDILIAAAIVVGFRYPAAWALPLLTKVAPGVGLLWFVFRREWGKLLLALSATAAIAIVSALIAPTEWRGWLTLLVRSFGEPQPVLWSYLAVPEAMRLPIAIAILWWGARTDRYWTVPFAVTLAMPILWANIACILLGCIPLTRVFGMTPARAWLFGEHGERVPSGSVARPGERSPAT